MAKPDERPIDEGLVALRGGDEAKAVEFWKARFELIAAVPAEIARVGALVPTLRELARLPADERRRLTRARVHAFTALPSDQRDKIAAARTAAFEVDRELLEADEAIVEQVRAEVPGAAGAYPGRD